MSGQIKLKAATLGGDITLSPTDTASNLVVTIPAVTATLLNNLSDIETQVKTATSATGDAPIFSCRAWVNFNGSGTVAIRASGNVSSITDNGTGDYTVNFTTAMEDEDYSVGGVASKTASTGHQVRVINVVGNSVPTTSGCRVCVDFAGNTSNIDETYVMAQIFR